MEYIVCVSADGLLSLCNLTEKRVDKVISLNQEGILNYLFFYIDGCDRIVVDLKSQRLYISSLTGSIFCYYFPGTIQYNNYYPKICHSCIQLPIVTIAVYVPCR